MELRDKLQLGTIGLLCLLLLGVGGVAAWYRYSYEKQIISLQNKVAAQDKTIEAQKGVYTRLVVQTDEVKSLLNKKDAQVKLLLDEVKKQKSELLTATTATATWKKAYEGLASATGTTVPVEGQPTKTRERVDFTKDFGYIKVEGWTLSSPPEAWVKVAQQRPLRLTVAIAQANDKSWRSYVTSSEENVSVDIQVSSVNPQMLKPRWYEKIGVAVDVGAGVNQSGVGALFGFGLNYQIGQFTVGPHAWFGISKTVDKYAGISFEWRPFQQK